MLSQSLLILATAFSAVLASPMPGTSGASQGPGGLQSLEARKICAFGYMACHYKRAIDDIDLNKYTCISPTCSFLRSCSCPPLAGFKQRPAYLFAQDCQSRAEAQIYPVCSLTSGLN